MFENLLNLVKENAGEAIINNPAIPNHQNDVAISTATNGIMDHLKSLTSNGDMEKITSMFQTGSIGSHPEVSNIANSVAGKLMDKFGINSGQASGIVNMLIPIVMTKLVGKTNDPRDQSFDLGGIIGALAGGNTSNIGGLMDGLKKMF